MRSRASAVNDMSVRLLTFFGAMAAVLAQSNDLYDPKTWAGAIAAGCGGVLALMRVPGQPPARPPFGGPRA